MCRPNVSTLGLQSHLRVSSSNANSVHLYRQAKGRLLLIAPFWINAHWLQEVFSLMYREPGRLRYRTCSWSTSLSLQLPPLYGMATFKAVLTDTGISEKVAQFLSASWQGSTVCQYWSVWKSWFDWCQGHRLDPAQVSVNTLLKYLY
jgi:hypothetical protein